MHKIFRMLLTLSLFGARFPNQAQPCRRTQSARFRGQTSQLRLLHRNLMHLSLASVWLTLWHKLVLLPFQSYSLRFSRQTTSNYILDHLFLDSTYFASRNTCFKNLDYPSHVTKSKFSILDFVCFQIFDKKKTISTSNLILSPSCHRNIWFSMSFSDSLRVILQKYANNRWRISLIKLNRNIQRNKCCSDVFSSWNLFKIRSKLTSKLVSPRFRGCVSW